MSTSHPQPKNSSLHGASRVLLGLDTYTATFEMLH